MVPVLSDKSEIDRLIKQIDVQRALRDMFQELAMGDAVQPPQSLTLFPGGKGDVISYQGVLGKSELFGVKLSPYIVGDDKPTVTAWTYLMSMDTGQPLFVCDSMQLTVERTAGTTALAVDLLSHSTSDVLCILGSGNIAMAHWRHVKPLRNWREVRLWSPNLAKDKDKLQLWQQNCDQLKVCGSAEEAASGADAILLCTSSGTPVLETDVVKNGALVTSISTNVAKAHEVAPAFLNDAQVYCDYKETTPKIAGEMLLACEHSGWEIEQVVGDLPELVTGKCAQPDSAKPVFFRSMGLGLEDVAIAGEIYRAYQATGQA